ncbi:RNA polymerase sigma factor [Opitutus terrae]|uniref:RNA polymerase, sigma-24 subunit, ECF subfamily n=1 Tax=Opitutus terrae (strain DSM 11246 / JCM 15787 / PB90-1) TaxID=452637 RepID=B1ZW55_OPITP|nr:sigma-70 family RNA polymerase sigma factor [Opitutus terrae]ACB76069.1 RNA polymerase, sigma-24 subunit, ECF subfamily [Opitutus terrae PB90-1]
MIEDLELLRRYAETGSEAAFAELVRRRIGLVYSVALRHTRDPHLAQDATQTVFADLARKAATLSKQTVLIGWFHRSAHYAAMNIMRAEWSRSAREREVQHMHRVFAGEQPPEAWENARPLLDEVLSELEAKDRDAILLRYLDGCGFAEVGARLGLSENAARMRVDRALDKLQAGFARRRLTSSAAVLGTVLAQQALADVPAGLASVVAHAALSSAAAGTAPALTFVQIMTTTKMIASVGGLALTMAIVGAGYQMHVRRAAETELNRVTQEHGALNTKRETLERAAADAERHVAELKQAAAEAETKRIAQATAAQQLAARHANWNPTAEGKALLERYPELKSWVQTVADAGFESRFGGFCRSLGLNPEQVAQLRMIYREFSSMGATFRGEMVSLPAGRGISWQESDRALRALLGDENATKFREYGRGNLDRRLATQLAKALCFSDAPLTPAQSAYVVQLIGESRGRDAKGAPGPVDWDRVVAEAKDRLSTDQLAALQAMRPDAAVDALFFQPD